MSMFTLTLSLKSSLTPKTISFTHSHLSTINHSKNFGNGIELEIYARRLSPSCYFLVSFVFANESLSVFHDF